MLLSIKAKLLDGQIKLQEAQTANIGFANSGLDIETISSSNSVPAGFSQADTKNYKKIAAKPRRKNKF